VALALALALGGCGSSSTGGSVPETTPTVALTTSPPQSTTPTTVLCRAISFKALDLLDAYRLERRGIVAPDEAHYRRQAVALRDEAVAAGCPVPATLNPFLR
jgi:hypothetical protein